MNNNSPSNGQTVFADTDLYADLNHETPILIQYWHAILRHKIAIAIILAVCIAVGIISTLLMTPYYTSTATVEINREQDKVTNVEGVTASDSTSQNLEFYQTQYSLLESRSLAERVVRAQNLVAKDDFFEKFNVDPDNTGLLTENVKTQSAAQRDARFKLAADILQEHISISPIRGSSLVEISFQSPSAALSAQIANTWVEQFIASNLDRRFSSTADARKFLEAQLADLKQKLEDSERNLSAYADNKQIITLSSEQTPDGKTISQTTLASANLEALNAALAVAIADRIAAESEANGRAGNKNALTNAALNNLRQERAKVQAEYAKLMVQFEPEYPAAKALASQVAALDRSIATEEARSRTGTSSRYQEALDREQQLRAQVNSLKNEFSGERRDSIQYNIFQREVDTNRQLYDGLLQRYKEIGVAGVGTNNISVVDRAQPPAGPSSPHLMLNIALAILTGMGLAAAYVFIMEQIDQTVKDPSDLKFKLGIAPLGSIPDLDKEDILISLGDKKSVAWEAYLSIRTSLAFLTDHGVPRSFLLTSTRANEGKSTSTLALAAVLASTKKRILLIDGDMRNPSLHEMLNGKNTNGLSNYLAGEDNLDKLICHDSLYDFDTMFAGPIPPNAAELLSSTRMRELVAKLSETYDTVIIDAPPVLGLADIPLLADSVEGVIYTIEAGGVKLRGIQAALQRVRSSHAHIFGGIVTKVQAKHGGYGYAYEYSYGNKTPTVD
ncbi:MAG: polysaccharide biosynthesis tyrosine autokinase [Sphingomonadales bacterium]|nr:polysaccharide biosynthesis tyrosine autokinase [Sphingomonadales bacterium]NCO50019.1 polysaccharide biosynthesis tyrosine autokinase [Sphingomonadales bacterium]NCP43413.1 polysaccharide biosynthesis tyrosine autokinase [Sphingomonadales bacterium]NCP50041.1 polysaccharide biosynthesis tyrosine autokinase [Sphingomonadales bacterium]